MVLSVNDKSTTNTNACIIATNMVHRTTSAMRENLPSGQSADTLQVLMLLFMYVSVMDDENDENDENMASRWVPSLAKSLCENPFLEDESPHFHISGISCHRPYFLLVNWLCPMPNQQIYNERLG